MKNCPICGKEMKVERSWLDGRIMLEESMECPDGHYATYFETGHTAYYVDGKEVLIESYDDPLNEGDYLLLHEAIRKATGEEE